jgi:MtN3 and saliva related transmembrane protein
MSTVIAIIMIIGAVFIGIFSLPNLINVLKTRNTLSINLWMYLIFVFACLMFLIYGLGMTIDRNYEGGLPILISNLLCVVIGIITLTIKLRNIYYAKKNNLTEEKYWETHYKR